ncbi:MAG: NTP transferase domain-containing protein [Candidatus Moranbacteria bacterium]|nr:NTP transferase domain-containing protein [Candidatus Moranbacteria bacterium]NTW45654.1 NTP transferase domain-containing protein [Candidatus Moranbacteria bacterium]
MKGIILAGGTGTRLLPLTAVLVKQLLPVYDRPMIFYPLNTLIKAGIRDILIIVPPEYSGSYLNLLGSMFSGRGINISFVVQKRPGGLPEAFILGEDFLDGGASTLILGDNIFEDDFTDAIGSFTGGGRIFAKEVPDPERYGVVEFENGTGKVLSIEEKPSVPKSRFAIPGIYVYDGRASEIARGLSRSERGELEIVDMHRAYLDRGELDVRSISGAYFDAGTHDSLLEASVYVKEKGFGSRFHPIVNDAISEFDAEYKRLVSLQK